MKSLLILLFTPIVCLASYPEFFGGSFSTSAIGNQSNFSISDASNNYFIPALLGFSQKVSVSLSASSTVTNFKPISNIVVRNNTNSGSTAYGNANTDYPKFYGANLHFALPIGPTQLGTLGISVFNPIGNLMETNSGDPYLPEYSMYHSRYRRTSIYVNFAKKWTEQLAFSLGAIMGFQAAADAYTQVSLSGSSYNSSASTKTKIEPSLGIIASSAYQTEHWKFGFTYQQEMKSNLKANASGEINDPVSVPILLGLDSVIFYDPHIFRLGTTTTRNAFDFYGTLEYQMWSGYEPPKLNINNRGSVLMPSRYYENLDIQDIIIPKLGMTYHFNDQWKVHMGASYRPTPFKGDFSGPGNTIDSNSYIATTGLGHDILIFEKMVQLGLHLQYHQLEKKTVVKTTGQENGNAGTKIGGPGYEIGGHILSAGMGMNVEF